MSKHSAPSEENRQLRETIEKWIGSISQYTPPEWGQLPELELYMDQVITYMNRQFEYFSSDSEKPLTPSMINNYVKDEVIPRPEKKKYSRTHLAMLMMICSTKSVLLLPEISAMLKGLTAGDGIEAPYLRFSQMLGNAASDVAARVAQSSAENDREKYDLALQLAIESNLRRVAAIRLLSGIETEPGEDDADT